MDAFKGCFCLAKPKKQAYENAVNLASETPFTVNEIEALYDLFKKLRSSIDNDGHILKEYFLHALFRDSNKSGLFVDTVFDLFDLKRNGVIGFGEFVRSLSIFHPSYPQSEKITFAFRLYDLRGTGYIEHVEVREMVLAVLNESDVTLSDEDIESIVDKTMEQADTKGDGKIDLEEWKDFVAKNPDLLKNMTLPCLKELTLQFPSFVLNTEVPD